MAVEILKMKKIKAFFVILGFAAASASAVEIAPYYNYQLSQGLSVSPDGDLGFLLNLSNDIGTIVQPMQDHRFIGYYSIRYQGPGLKRQEGRRFRERYINHIFATRHHWNIADDMTLKSQMSVLLERRRSGTNETWQSGLYNFNRYGGSTSLEKEMFGIDSTLSLGYHFISFPNYSDLLSELREGADAGATEGTQNHHSLRLGYSGSLNFYRFSIALNPLFYTKQKVAVDRAQKDGSFYSDTRQRELIINASGSRAFLLSQSAIVAPELKLKYKNSNQNYQHFEYAASTKPVKFFDNYFDYIEPSVSLPLSLKLSDDWTYFFSPSLTYRQYINRTPRDSEGDFIDGKKQNRLLGIHSTGFKKQTGESSSTTLFFTYQHQSSNMKFERYLPYNYDGFSMGLRFQMEY